MYPNLYYAFQDLFGLSIPALKMLQSFGFFVALAFLAANYTFTLELKRKENEGKVFPYTIKFLKGAKAPNSELVTSAIIGLLIGFKLVYIAQNFNSFLDDTQGFILSTQGSLIGALLGAGLGYYLRYYESNKNKLDKPIEVDMIVHPYELVGNMTFIAAVAGLIGAKIFHNLENWDDFMVDPIGSLVSFSGLTMYGGLICGGASVIWYARKKNINIPHLIDACAPGLMLAYGVGRIGCHTAGDGDWGIEHLSQAPSFIPQWLWGYTYPHNVNNAGIPIEGCVGNYCHALPNPVYPTALYEAIACISLFFVLWQMRKKIIAPGVLFSVYLIMNGVERFLVELIRVNTKYNVLGLSFTQAELISLILFTSGVYGVYYFRKKAVTTN